MDWEPSMSLDFKIGVLNKCFKWLVKKTFKVTNIAKLNWFGIIVVDDELLGLSLDHLI